LVEEDETGAIAMTRLRQDGFVLHGIASPVLTVVRPGNLQTVNDNSRARSGVIFYASFTR
jgi:hypothetical protein